jgi:hypothetical protein
LCRENATSEFEKKRKAMVEKISQLEKFLSQVSYFLHVGSQYSIFFIACAGNLGHLWGLGTEEE